MSQDSSGLLAAAIAAIAGIGGVIIGALLDYKLSEGREKKRKHDRDQRERTTAYVGLKNTLIKIRSGSYGTRKPIILELADYDQLSQIVAQHFPVLDESTRKAWETAKKTLSLNLGFNPNLRNIDLDGFDTEVTKKYNELLGIK